MTEQFEVVGMEAFYTREKANKGIALPLYLPTGERADHWIHVRGIDSDEFRAAEAERKREALRIAMIEDPKERTLAIADARASLLAALVIDWSFAEPCTLENMKRFFREAPQLADSIDRAASRRDLFFREASRAPDADHGGDELRRPASPESDSAEPGEKPNDPTHNRDTDQANGQADSTQEN